MTLLSQRITLYRNQYLGDYWNDVMKRAGNTTDPQQVMIKTMISCN